MTHREAIAAIRQRLGGTLTEEDKVQLLKVEQILKRLESGEDFHVANVISHETGKGRLDVSWMGMLAQLDPSEARAIAWMLVEAAAAAETESFLVRFLKENVGMQAPAAAQLLQDFRTYRQQDPHASLVGNKVQ